MAKCSQKLHQGFQTTKHASFPSLKKTRPNVKGRQKDNFSLIPVSNLPEAEGSVILALILNI